jgi:hypothetical protein
MRWLKITKFLQLSQTTAAGQAVKPASFEGNSLCFADRHNAARRLRKWSFHSEQFIQNEEKQRVGRSVCLKLN